MTDFEFIVFQDGLKGMKWIPQMGAETLEQAVQNITQGCVGMRAPSQNFIYYIYTTSFPSFVHLFGRRFDLFSFEKAVAGSAVCTPSARSGLRFALTAESSDAWFFTDDFTEDQADDSDYNPESDVDVDNCSQ